MKKILFLSLLISLKMFGQSVTIVPSNSLDNEFLKIKKYGIGLDHRSDDGLIGVGTYASGEAGYIQTHTNHPLRFATNNGSPKMALSTDGRLGIGIIAPNQILDINGRMRIRHTPGFTSGVWMSNSTNGLGDGDGAFIGLNTDTQAGIYIGNAWRFGFNSNGNAVITGFTQLGNTTPAGADASKTAPAIKTLKLTGTTSSVQGGVTPISHGLLLSKILSYTVLVDAGVSTFPPEVSRFGSYKYSTYCDSSSIYVANDSNFSSDILSKPFKILITYEE